MCESFKRPVSLTKQEIKQVFRNGDFLRKSEGTCRYLRSSGRKYGIVITKKVGHAVDRNLMRRWLRTAVIRKMQDRANLWIVIILYKRLTDYNAAMALVSDIIDGLNRRNHENNNYRDH